MTKYLAFHASLNGSTISPPRSPIMLDPRQHVSWHRGCSVRVQGYLTTAAVRTGNQKLFKACAQSQSCGVHSGRPRAGITSAQRPAANGHESSHDMPYDMGPFGSRLSREKKEDPSLNGTNSLRLNDEGAMSQMPG